MILAGPVEVATPALNGRGDPMFARLSLGPYEAAIPRGILGFIGPASIGDGRCEFTARLNLRILKAAAFLPLSDS